MEDWDDGGGAPMPAQKWSNGENGSDGKSFNDSDWGDFGGDWNGDR